MYKRQGGYRAGFAPGQKRGAGNCQDYSLRSTGVPANDLQPKLGFDVKEDSLTMFLDLFRELADQRIIPMVLWYDILGNRPLASLPSPGWNSPWLSPDLFMKAPAPKPKRGSSAPKERGTGGVTQTTRSQQAKAVERMPRFSAGQFPGQGAIARSACSRPGSAAASSRPGQSGQPPPPPAPGQRGP